MTKRIYISDVYRGKVIMYFECETPIGDDLSQYDCQRMAPYEVEKFLIKCGLDVNGDLNQFFINYSYCIPWTSGRFYIDVKDV